MASDRFDTQLEELVARIESLPEGQRSGLREMLKETRARHAEIREHVRRARNALDDWRILQKYRIFDIEATLREQAAKRLPPTEDDAD